MTPKEKDADERVAAFNLKMKGMGWSTEDIPAFPGIVGRYFRRIGKYEIDIESLMGGAWYVAAYDCEFAGGSFPELIGVKEHHDNILGALVSAFALCAFAEEGQLEHVAGIKKVQQDVGEALRDAAL